VNSLLIHHGQSISNKIINNCLLFLSGITRYFTQTSFNTTRRITYITLRSW